MRVLLADDDTYLVGIMCYALRREGYTVLTAADGASALALWQEQGADFALLDVGLPKADGFHVCRQIREQSMIPIIMVTARYEDANVIQGLQCGADDYLLKPFSLRQLCARMNAVRRRSQQNRYERPGCQVEIDDLTLDLEAHQASRRGEPFNLTQREFRIFYILAVNEGRTVPYRELIQFAWGHEGPAVGAVKTHVSHIRKALASTGPGCGDIAAIPTVGYRYTGVRTGIRPSSRTVHHSLGG
jgi:DNA-binding response OmpR family regulator